jgi:acid phosphatase
MSVPAASSGLLLYVDGALEPLTSGTGAIGNTTNTKDVLIGARRDASNTDLLRVFTGALDEIRIYPRVITAAEVQALYNAVSFPPTATLTVSPTSISSGGSALLSWSSTGATSCTGTGFAASGTSGSLSVSPTATTTYSIICTGTGGTTPSTSATLTVAAAPPPGPFNHIVLVLFENTNYASVIGSTSAPYFNTLANTYGLATQYFANTHPSIGNYFELTVGQILTNDDNVTPAANPVSADNVVRRLLAAGKTWKAYEESLPSIGYTGNDVLPNYSVRHNPFAYFTDVQNVPAQKSNLVPFEDANVGFAHDLAAGPLPNYSFVMPNMCNSAHDCPLSTADTWLQTNLGPLINNTTLMQDTLVIVVFDESANDNTNGGGLVYWTAVSPKVRPAYKSTTVYQHQSTLRETLEGLDLPSNLGDAATAPSMGEFFVSSAPGRAAPGGLLGVYGQVPSTFQAAYGRLPDFQGNQAYTGPAYGGSNGGVNSGSLMGGYPFVAGFGVLGNDFTCAMETMKAAASGTYDAADQTSVNNNILAGGVVYAIRFNWEWQGSYFCFSPWPYPLNETVAPDPSGNGPVWTPAVWAAATARAINLVKATPGMGNVKIEIDAPADDTQATYIDALFATTAGPKIDLLGLDIYFGGGGNPGTSDDGWNYAAPQLAYQSAYARAHNKPMYVGEWCDQYTDGVNITRFAQWMKDNNVVGHMYWDDDSSGPICTLHGAPARLAAWNAAFANTSYQGNFWTLKPLPAVLTP